MSLRLAPEQALGLWHAATSELVRGAGPDLTARQTAILLRVYLEDGPHTVRGLASALRLVRPAVTRALDRLERLKLVSRLPDPQDRRSITVQRTFDGLDYLDSLGILIAACAPDADHVRPLL
jgi:DNA-binding MarR family transcriptional regulator